MSNGIIPLQTDKEKLKFNEVILAINSSPNEIIEISQCDRFPFNILKYPNNFLFFLTIINNFNS